MAERAPKQVKGPIRDPEAARVCGLHDISAQQQQLVTLRQLQGALQTAIDELEREHEHERFVNRAFMVLRFTKATCDAFVGMAQTFVGTFIPASAKAAKQVGAGYKAGTTLGDALGTKIAGGRVDYAKKGLDLAKAGSTLIDDEGYGILAKSMIVKGEIIHAAMNNDREEVVKDAAKYGYELHAKIAELGLKSAGHNKTGKAVKLFTDTAKRAFEYNEELGKVFDEMIESQEEGDQRYISLKTTLLKQAKRIAAQISELERTVGADSKPAPVPMP